MRNRLREIRLRKGLTQRELTEKSGVAKSTISELENGGNHHPTIDVGYKLQEALNVDVWTIFFE